MPHSICLAWLSSASHHYLMSFVDFDAVKSKFGQHDEYDIHGIAHVHTFRKDDIFMQRPLLHCTALHIYMEVGARDQKPRGFVL